jgi:chemotaxis protein CheX
MVSEIDELVKEAVKDVFSTMLGMNAEVDPKADQKQSDEELISGAVGFTGKITGVVFINTVSRFAKQITSSMLGLSPDEIDGDEMVNDTMGELANMIVGQVKSRLCDRGYECVLTVPSVVRGQNFSIESTTGTERRVIGFNCGAEKLKVEVLIKHENNQ